jgi:hypothetical protein
VHEKSGKRTAHRLLRSSGFTLPWIDERRGIEADVEAALADLNRSWAWVQDQSDDAWAEDAWERALQTFQAQAVKLNRRVRDYTDERPCQGFCMELIRESPQQAGANSLSRKSERLMSGVKFAREDKHQAESDIVPGGGNRFIRPLKRTSLID